MANAADDGDMDFDSADLRPRSRNVLLGGKRYVLREATEDAAVRFRNTAMRAARMTDGKVTGVDGMADVEPQLVADCLFEVLDKKPDGEPVVGKVAVGFVRGLPARVVQPMFDWVKRASGLASDDDPAAEDSAAGKAPPSTPAT